MGRADRPPASGFAVRMMARIAHWWAAFARKRALAMVTMGMLPVLARLALLPIYPIPVPAVHDEFSYLFAAKTFLLGRLANPTPPLWIHFQTFHILDTPTYTSIFPIGQGLLLAAGQLLFGNYWFGVCLSVGAMCATLVWMLYGWLPPRWAVFGGLLAVLQFGIAHYWMNSYWGGALAAVGGNLLLGSIPRLKAQLRSGYAVAAGIGVGILATTRTFEGMLLTLFVFASILYWQLRYSKYTWKDVTLRGLLPFGAVLLPVLILMGLQFRAATGSPFSIPHQLYRQQLTVMPTFAWQKPHPEPAYRHAVIREFFVNWEPNYQNAKGWGTLRGTIPALRERARTWGASYFPGAPYLPLALLSLLAGFSARIRWLGFCIVMAFLGTCLTSWTMPHYMAPILGALMAVHVQFLRYVHAWKWGDRRIGRWAFVGILVFMAVLFGIRYSTRVVPYPEYWAVYRDRMERMLERQPGKQLVFVRYTDRHLLQDEWVYNEPDIPKAKVIWSRMMTPEEDEELRAYYRDRAVWVLDADAHPPQLQRLTGVAP
jgi:hypothetical protein